MGVMKKVIAVFLCLQVIWAAAVPEPEPASVLVPVLGRALGVKVTEGDGSLVLEGSDGLIQKAYRTLSNIHELRKCFFPVSNKVSGFYGAIGTEKNFTCWDDFFQALSIVGLRSATELGMCGIDEKGVKIYIPQKINVKPYGSEVLLSSFANDYIRSLNKISPLFKWACINVPGFITEEKEQYITGSKIRGFITQEIEYRVIHYSLLNPYLSWEEMRKGIHLTSAQPAAFVVSDESVLDVPSFSAAALVSSQLVIPASSILKRLIAASGGDVTLVPVDGKYNGCHVYIISLGESENTIKFNLLGIPDREVTIKTKTKGPGLFYTGQVVHKGDGITRVIGAEKVEVWWKD